MCGPVTDKDDASQHAADEPTAMWDEDALAQLGLGGGQALKSDQAPKASLAAAVETNPADQALARGPSAAGSATVGPATAGPATVGSGGSLRGWVVTLVLAVGLGVAVYFAVRALR